MGYTTAVSDPANAGKTNRELAAMTGYDGGYSYAPGSDDYTLSFAGGAHLIPPGAPSPSSSTGFGYAPGTADAFYASQLATQHPSTPAAAPAAAPSAPTAAPMPDVPTTMPLSGSIPSASSTAPLQAMSAGGGSATSEGFATERSPELDTGLSQRQMPASSYALSRLASSRGGRVY